MKSHYLLSLIAISSMLVCGTSQAALLAAGEEEICLALDTDSDAVADTTVDSVALEASDFSLLDGGSFLELDKQAATQAAASCPSVPKCYVSGGRAYLSYCKNMPSG